MKIKINYHAYSNISYRGTWEMDVDDNEWNEASQRERNKMVNEYAEDEILNDIAWDYEESAPNEDL